MASPHQGNINNAIGNGNRIGDGVIANNAINGPFFNYNNFSQSPLNRDTLTEQDVFRYLGPTDSAAVLTDILGRKDKLLDGSCDWVFKDPAFKTWLDSPAGSHIFWLHGDPGKGKTMITYAATQYLSDHLKSSPGRRQMSYFFCQRNNGKLNTALAIMKGLVRHLAVSNQDFLSYLCSRLRNAIEEEDSDLVLSFLWNALHTGISELSINPAVLIVDALDECEMQERQKLLQHLVRLDRPQHQSVKWFISSRNQPDIHDALQVDAFSNHTSLELNVRHVRSSVDAFISAKVRELSSRGSLSPETILSISQNLQKNSQGTFLWVALVCEELRKVSNREIISVLRRHPPGLSAIYNHMLAEVESQSDSGNVRYCRSLLSTLAVAMRPLHMLELPHFCELDDHSAWTFSDLETLVKKCAAFLIVRDQIVYWVHQSAVDFITAALGRSDFPLPAEDHHFRLFKYSLRLMSDNLKANMCQLQDPATHASDISNERIRHHIPVHLQYACRCWVLHFFRSGQNLNTLADFCLDFIREKALIWLEVQSITDSSNYPPPTFILFIKNLFASHFSPRISSMANYPKEFTSSNFATNSNLKTLKNLTLEAAQLYFLAPSVIAAFPLQIHLVAAIFGPLENSYRIRAQNSMQGALRTINGPPEDSDSLRTFTHDADPEAREKLDGVSFSSNGDLLLACFQVNGTRDLHFKVWSMPFGTKMDEIKFALDPHENYHRYILSPTAACAAVQFYDGLYLLDLFTGAQRMISAAINTEGPLAFNKGGTCIVFPIPGPSVTIYNIEKSVTGGLAGACTDFALHEAFGVFIMAQESTPMGFAPSLVIFDFDILQPRCTIPLQLGDPPFSIKIDDLGNMAVIQSGSIFEVMDLAKAGAPNGEIIWTVDTKCQFRLSAAIESHEWALSPDGDHLATAVSQPEQDRSAIYLWSAVTGERIGTLRPRIPVINSLVYSPDNSYFAVTSPTAVSLHRRRKYNSYLEADLIQAANHSFEACQFGRRSSNICVYSSAGVEVHQLKHVIRSPDHIRAPFREAVDTSAAVPSEPTTIPHASCENSMSTTPLQPGPNECGPSVDNSESSFQDATPSLHEDLSVTDEELNSGILVSRYFPALKTCSNSGTMLAFKGTQCVDLVPVLGGQPRRILGPKSVQGLQFLPEERLLLVIDIDTIDIFDTETLERVSSMPHDLDRTKAIRHIYVNLQGDVVVVQLSHDSIRTYRSYSVKYCREHFSELLVAAQRDQPARIFVDRWIFVKGQPMVWIPTGMRVQAPDMNQFEQDVWPGRLMTWLCVSDRVMIIQYTGKPLQWLR